MKQGVVDVVKKDPFAGHLGITLTHFEEGHAETKVMIVKNNSDELVASMEGTVYRKKDYFGGVRHGE
jgi:hypothetical protein